jgi:hypothetical protein
MFRWLMVRRADARAATWRARSDVLQGYKDLGIANNTVLDYFERWTVARDASSQPAAAAAGEEEEEDEAAEQVIVTAATASTQAAVKESQGWRGIRCAVSIALFKDFSLFKARACSVQSTCMHDRY